jgi:hypothetical protein
LHVGAAVCWLNDCGDEIAEKTDAIDAIESVWLADREREMGVLVSVCSNSILPMLFIYDRSMAAIYDKATALTNPRDF